MIASTPLTLGQLAIWRDVEGVPRDRWHEPNLAQTWALPAGTGSGLPAVREAIDALTHRHESLRATYDLTEPGAPRQLTHPPGQPAHAQVERIADPRTDLEAIHDRCLRQPLSLTDQPPWRATLIAPADTPTHVVLVHHHIVADAAASAVLKRDFFAALAGTLDGAVSGPRTILAREQSEAGLRRATAALDYWAKLLPEARIPAVGEPPFVEARLVSATAAGAARRVAARLRISLPNVVLAAYCAALLALTADDRLTVRLLSSNRFDPYRRDVVTSMNQWIPVLVDRPSTPSFTELAQLVRNRARVAYAHGVYDVDTVFRLLDEAGYRREQYDSTWSFNFITGQQGDRPAGAEVESAGAHDEPIAWAPPLSSVGPRYYLRVREEERLIFELRVPVAQSALAEDLLGQMCQALLRADRAS